MRGVDPLNFLVRGVFILYAYVLRVSLNKREYFLCLLPSRIGRAEIHNRQTQVPSFRGDFTL